MAIVIGERYKRWLVQEFAGYSPAGLARYLCVCVCGTIRIVTVDELESGVRLRCACRSVALHRSAILGPLRRSPEYMTWIAMIARCTRPTNANYVYYGGRGIKVCQRWLLSFADFASDMGPRPPRHTIERLNVDGDYEPTNCVWLSIAAQALNRRSNRRVAYRGMTLTVSEWAALLGIPPSTLAYRLRAGWSVERALSK